MFWVYAALAVSLVSFFVAAYFYNWVTKTAHGQSEAG